MHLAQIHVKNFRNLVDVQVDLRKGLTVLVGENNIGKTNLIDALRFALGPASTGVIRSVPKKEDLSRESGSAAFSVDLLFCELKPEEMSQFVECLSYDHSDPSRSTLEIHYTWRWDEVSCRYHEERSGGLVGSDSSIPSEVLQSIPFVYLEPLRDALATLTAGRSNRIGALLRRLAGNDAAAKARITDIFTTANSALEVDNLISSVTQKIQANITGITSAELGQGVSLRASAQEFESVVNSLSLVLKLARSTAATDPEAEESRQFDFAEIRENGLGYNNVLYIATVLAELANMSPTDFPILCVEEPEAHLHPQLQLLLGDYFRIQAARATNPIQVILTTHSPNLSSQLPLDSLNVLHFKNQCGGPKRIASATLWNLGLSDPEQKKLERLIDATKASIFFAKAVILVEGPCEQFLVPALARQLGIDLAGAAISVVPLNGLTTSSVLSLFVERGLQIKCAVLSDGDPPTEIKTTSIHADLANGRECWHTYPVLTSSPGLAALSADSASVKHCRNIVTLEYDLAECESNATALVVEWRRQFPGLVPELTAPRMATLSDSQAKATFFWQSCCLVSGGSRKAAFSQNLALELAEGRVRLAVPRYIKDAFVFLGVLAPEAQADAGA